MAPDRSGSETGETQIMAGDCLTPDQSDPAGDSQVGAKGQGRAVVGTACLENDQAQNGAECADVSDPYIMS